MAEKIRNAPIIFSIVFTLVITISWGISLMFIGEALFLASVATIVFGVLAVILIGFINQNNGFKHTFGIKGFSKGLLALLPVTVFIIYTLALDAIGMEEISFENPINFSLIALEIFISSFLANVLFRGLLITALFIKFSDTENERVKSIFKASALYLVIYIIILNTGEIHLIQVVNTFIVGAGFCAAYLYSKNLLSLFLVQGIWQVLDSAIGFFGIVGDVYVPPVVRIELVIILILIAVFAVVVGRRSEPFKAR